LTATAARAELIGDRGDGAVSDHFFRSRPFMDAAVVTHTLRIEAPDGELLAPLVVREIPDALGARDAISPYGYPGLVWRSRGHARRSLPAVAPAGMPPTLLDPAKIDFSATGLVSAFIRHTLDEPPPLAGAGERTLVQIADPALPRKQRSSDRNQINKNRRNGYRVRLVPGPESSAAERAGFLTAYEQTMRRAGAGERYFFGAAYFDRILEFERSWLALALAPDASIAAASIAAVSDGFLHYYLSGSRDSHLSDSPMKNVVAALVELAIELGLPLNLGGGISRGDALEDFKRGFANREALWRSSELVCDRDAYARLSAGLGDEVGGFFPAYRRST
jgi:Acetyltransferase (GNAT) domain